MTSQQSPEIPIPRKLWVHPAPQNTHMAKFIHYVNHRRRSEINGFQDLYEYSIGKHRSHFWEDAFKYFKIIHEGHYSQVVEQDKRMDQIPKWFKGVKLNFAENVLFTTSSDLKSRTSMEGKEDSKVALTEVREGCTEIRDVTWRELRSKVGRLSSAMRAHGVVKGDRVAIVASNSVDTLVVFLAITSIGGLFSSSSTDMGTKGILDRLLQIKPKWLFMDDAALYNGKTIDLRDKMTEVVNGMASVQEFQGIVSMPRWSKPIDVTSVPKTVLQDDYLRMAKSDQLQFERVSFDDPFLIVYSSGTTGQPKCIVHATGNVIVSAFKENVLHRDFGPHTVALQYTTTGWIMYLTSIVSLLHGARVVLYDGSPFQPDATRFVKLVGEQKVTHLGVSPKWMQTMLAANIVPRNITDLSNLERVCSTGMVLPDSLFLWFYDVAFPKHTQLANISGGTDIAGCFAMENPLIPLYCGGCMGPALGTAVTVYDSTTPSPEDGSAAKGVVVPDGVPGELVAYQSFPNMPVIFWPGDKTAMNKYHDAYFAKFDNVWTHGDFIQVHPVTKQITFLGRADGVLNPSGVRFGSAELYNVIEQHFPKEIADSIVVGQRRPQDTDESVIMFLKMQPNVKFSREIVDGVKSAIAKECSKRHVPKYVFETPEIPTTVNLKKVELPIKHIVSGRTVKPSGTLLNPDSLKYYYQFADDAMLTSDPFSGQSKL